MNNPFFLQQLSRASNFDASLISRQYKLNLMAAYMRLKYENLKLKQSEIANQIGYSSSTLQRYRNDINMLSPYRIQSYNTNKGTKKVSKTNFNNNSHREPDVKRNQMTSNYLKTTQTNTKSNKKNKTILKPGSTHENTENNGQYLDETVQNNYL